MGRFQPNDSGWTTLWIVSARSRRAAPSAARHGLCVAALAVLLGACGSTATPTTSIGSRAPAATASPSVTASPISAASPAPSSAFDPAALTIRLDPVVDGLDSPLAVVNAGDGSGRLFVVERPGRIRIVKDGVLAKQPFLDIAERIASGDERGLLGLAFAPDFPSDSRLFVDYTNRDGNSVIASFQVPAATPDQADPASERILLQFDQPFENHNGGGLAFGPDGDLYIAAGDGGSGGDPQGNGQKLTTVLGKLLRIRPGAPDGSQPPYSIPADAPFASDPNARPEIRAFGLRNPWRFSFDRATGDLWIGDVGQDAWEEVDVIRASDPPNVAPNFGWNIMEGRHCFNADRANRTVSRCPSPSTTTASAARSSAASWGGIRASPRSTAGTSTATTARATSGPWTRRGRSREPHGSCSTPAGPSRRSVRTRLVACTSPMWATGRSTGSSRSPDRYRMRKLTATVTVTSLVPASTGVGTLLSGAAAASRAP